VPRWDCHVHTHYTDGEPSVDAAVLRAIECGLERIIFTEHTEPWQARYAGWFADYLADIRTSQRKYSGQIEIVAGVEAPAIDFDGGLELTDEMVGNAEFILGAAHRYPGMGHVKTGDLGVTAAIDLEFRTLMALAVNPRIHAIAHLGGTCATYCGAFPADLTREVIRTATAHGVPVEINPQYHRPLETFLRLCLEEDAFVTFGSNAHTLDQIGSVHDAVGRILA
jgi:histidinol phosphatase-like PHP family hydrolase